MEDFSVIIAGKAGEGINQSGTLLGNLLSALGYRIYLYLDYPSLIRGGRNFALIRASKRAKGAHSEKADFLLALNQEAVAVHSGKLKDPNYIVFDSDTVVCDRCCGIPATTLVKTEKALPIMRNTILIAAFAKSVGISWDTLEKVVRKDIHKEIDLNLRLARQAYDQAKELFKLPYIGQKELPVLSGNEAIALGLVKAGLKAYLAYPMTPASSILHFLADKEDEYALKVLHPESEIAVMLMACGFAYTGQKVAVGSSGGGFCLMTEGLSFAGMAELPVTVVLSQRPGPSTGVPTYSAQGDLFFALHAGHGEFLKFVVAPGNVEESFEWARTALNISWKYQIPSIILTDKNLSEGSFSFDSGSVPDAKEEAPLCWDKKGQYKRYLDTASGISPLAFPSGTGAIVKANSYSHDEYGITTEEPGILISQQDKRYKKSLLLIKEVSSMPSVKIHGNKDAKNVLLTWGSSTGVCREAAEELGLKVVQVIVMDPFPLDMLSRALRGAERVIAVETNQTGQLDKLVRSNGIKTGGTVLRYDGRPFTVEGLVEEIKKRTLI